MRLFLTLALLGSAKAWSIQDPGRCLFLGKQMLSALMSPAHLRSIEYIKALQVERQKGLATEHLILQRLDPAHRADFESAIWGGASTLFAEMHSPAARAQEIKQMAEEAESLDGNPAGVVFAVHEKSGGTCIGFVEVKFQIDPANPTEHSFLRIPYAIDPKFQGKGYGSEIISTLVKFRQRHFPQTFPFQEVIFKPNPASSRIFEKLGFKVLRSYEPGTYTGDDSRAVDIIYLP